MASEAPDHELDEIEPISEVDSHIIKPSEPEEVLISWTSERFMADFQYVGNDEEQRKRAEVRACIAQRIGALRQVIGSSTEDVLPPDAGWQLT